MGKQLQGLSTGEIRSLIEEATAVLAEREAEERHLQEGREEQRDGQESARRGEGGRWLERELINCGNCRRCGDGGRHHGPYWYLYRYTGSRMTSRYVGRRLDAALAQELGKPELGDLTPEEAFPNSYPSPTSEE